MLVVVWERDEHAADGAAGGDERRLHFQILHCAEHFLHAVGLQRELQSF